MISFAWLVSYDFYQTMTFGKQKWIVVSLEPLLQDLEDS